MTDYACPHCGSTKDAWFSRTIPMCYVCPDCENDIDETNKGEAMSEDKEYTITSKDFILAKPLARIAELEREAKRLCEQLRMAKAEQAKLKEIYKKIMWTDNNTKNKINMMRLYSTNLILIFCFTASAIINILLITALLLN